MASPAELLAALRSRRSVYFGGTASLPIDLLSLLDAARHEFGPLEVVFGYLLDRPPICDHAGAPFGFVTLQPSSSIAADCADGTFDYLPISYGQISRTLHPGGNHPIDALVVQVSEPSIEGYFSLGPSNGPLSELIKTVPLVIGQVNKRMPRTFGSRLPRSAFDLLVQLDAALLESPSGAPGLDAERVAIQLAPLVPDEATLQTGVGRIPSALLPFLRNRRELRFHTGMIGDGVAELAASHALADVTTPAVVTAEIVGSRDLLDWAADNRMVEVASSEVTHRSRPANPGPFLAINGAIEVALDGSVNCEWVGEKQVSGPGGLPDFIRLAKEVEDGQSVIMLPARSSVGPRIRGSLAANRTTLGVGDVDVVVTEWGLASLRGLDPAECQQALIDVAHPDDQARLAAARPSADSGTM
jgi:acyl-CoA hydrolase